MAARDWYKLNNPTLIDSGLVGRKVFFVEVSRGEKMTL